MFARFGRGDGLRRVQFIRRADVNDIDLRILQEVVQMVITFWNRVLCRIALRALRAAAQHRRDFRVRP